jgi:hypothetical protein
VVMRWVVMRWVVMRWVVMPWSLQVDPPRVTVEKNLFLEGG